MVSDPWEIWRLDLFLHLFELQSEIGVFDTEFSQSTQSAVKVLFNMVYSLVPVQSQSVSNKGIDFRSQPARGRKATLITSEHLVDISLTRDKSEVSRTSHE